MCQPCAKRETLFSLQYRCPLPPPTLVHCSAFSQHGASTEDVFFFPGPGGSTRRKRRILGRLSSKPFDRHMARRFFFALSPLSRKSKLAWKSARGGWCLILRDTWYTVLQQEAFPCAPRRIYYCHTLVDATTRTTRVDCLTDRPLHLFIRTRFDPLTDRPLH